MWKHSTVDLLAQWLVSLSFPRDYSPVFTAKILLLLVLSITDNVWVFILQACTLYRYYKIAGTRKSKSKCDSLVYVWYINGTSVLTFFSRFGMLSFHKWVTQNLLHLIACHNTIVLCHGITCNDTVVWYARNLLIESWSKGGRFLDAICCFFTALIPAVLYSIKSWWLVWKHRYWMYWDADLICLQVHCGFIFLFGLATVSVYVDYLSKIKYLASLCLVCLTDSEINVCFVS